MYTELFFDDYRLLGRTGTERRYGVPELINEYYDPEYSTDYFSPWVFDKDGETVMLYMGRNRTTGKFALLAASSPDGIDFSPLKHNGTNEVMQLAGGEEPLSILEDVFAPPEEKYKLILTRYNQKQFCVRAQVLSSPDLIMWSNYLDEIPDCGCEPVGGVFFNAHRQCYTVLRRPTWGNRCVGYCDTKDFKHYTEYELCLHQDALDGPLDEIYGMSAFGYAGMYIGFPLIYTDNAPSRKAKFEPGSIVPQLAYSWDGHHFLRSLRTSFLPDYTGEPALFWLSCARMAANREILLYCAMTPEAHGTAFRNHQSGRIRIYRLREDGLISLNAGADEATVTTREYLYKGGDICVNLCAEQATVAVIDTCGEDPASQAWGTETSAAGFDHGDCQEFSGDSTCWRPRFKGGSLERFRDRIIILEIKLKNGALYSVSGDMQPLTNTQSARYRAMGIVSEI